MTEEAFHGNLGILVDISPKMHDHVPNFKPKNFVHVSPLPSSYRLSMQLEDKPADISDDDMDEWVAAKCAEKVDELIAKCPSPGIAAFICEPCFVSE